MYKRSAGELRAKLLSGEQDKQRTVTKVWPVCGTLRGKVGPGCGARGRRRGLAGLRDDAPSHRSETWPHWRGGRRRVRRARAGFEIDHSEPPGSRVAISRAAGPDGARNTRGATSNTSRKAAAHGHTKQPGPTTHHAAPGTPAAPQATQHRGAGPQARAPGATTQTRMLRSTDVPSRSARAARRWRRSSRSPRLRRRAGPRR